MRKVMAGWILVLVCYWATYLVSAWLYLLIFNRSIDSEWNKSGLFIGAFLIIIPYVAAGLFVRYGLDATIKQALWISVVPIISEKIFICLIGFILVGDPSVTNNVWLVIRGEFAPYFTPFYIAAGVLSMLVCLVVGNKKSPRAI